MTDFLFAEPNFISGFGSAFDLGGTMMMFNNASSPNEADALALANDWALVNKDAREAVSRELSLI